MGNNWELTAEQGLGFLTERLMNAMLFISEFPSRGGQTRMHNSLQQQESVSQRAACSRSNVEAAFTS